jgi:hypothetical protein|tara:strand:- start:586 stop:750 length:165 start_codon:yes stop_codon:yes gene_type:complete
MKVGSLVRRAHDFGLGSIGTVVGTSGTDGEFFVVKWLGSGRRVEVNPKFLELVS